MQRLRHLLLVTSLLAVASTIQAQEDKEQNIDAVSVEGRLKGIIRADGVQQSETITRTGLTKMACCTVAESFENSASVTVGYSDAVSGTRQIRLLGLSGAYTQMLDESRPILRGIGAPYAMSYTPGVWLNSVQISKGVCSVTAGHEAITGQINMEFRKPTDSERLFVNCYLDEMLRPELNLTSALPLRKDKSLNTIILLHGATDTEWHSMKAMDLNKDGFRDLPRNREWSVANKWLWTEQRTGLQLRWGGKYTQDERLGGSIHIKSAEKAWNSLHEDFFTYQEKDFWEPKALQYALNISNENANAYLKVALPFGDERRTDGCTEAVRSNVALVADFDHWGENAFFGLNEYRAEQNAVFLNLLANQYLRRGVITYGLQTRFDYVREHLLNPTPWMTTIRTYSSQFKENEIGMFAEYTLHTGGLSAVVGMRGDYNSHYQQLYLTPRFHLRWNIATQTTFRVSAGLGYRTPHLYTENIGMLATGRAILVDSESFSKPETALTTGISLIRHATLFGYPATFSADYFYTRFGRNLVIDQELAAEKIYVYPSEKSATTHTIQFDVSATPTKGLDLYAAFRLTSSYQYCRKQSDSMGDLTWIHVERPLTDRYKGLLNAQLYTPFRRWIFDATVQLNGPTRVPNETGSSLSPAYVQLYAQLTHKVKRCDLYLGCENIADYRQKNPVLYAEEPFSTDFNSMNVWGPLMGRRIYIGLRFNLY